MAVKSDGFGESFGQKRPPLYEMIKNILREYPNGQIFKEVIQNADDARATKVKFFLDSRHYQTLPTHGICLSDTEKEQYCGPALLSYNNAAFKKEDWQSIQGLYQSGKAKNPHKVGKFGIGFNSVYHVTDIPVILSQDYCGFLDPQERVWRDPDSNRGESGRGFYLSDLRDNCPQVLDQFHGICGFSKNDINFQDKTLLRFPLRNRPSKLSNEVYTIDKLHTLLNPLKEEAQYLLVYLRSVCSIEISQIDIYGKITSIFKVSIDAQSGIAQQRKQLMHSVETTFSGLAPYSIRKVIPDICHFTITMQEYDRITNSHEWLVVNQIGSEDSEVLELAEKQHVLPWVGIAVEMNSSPQSEGRIFCVLPLPVEDRAPFNVHVNGTFAVSSNRRSLKWEVQERKGDEEGKWNKLLVNKCLPSCYVKLVIQLMRLRHNDPTLIYSCWPDIDKVSCTPWSDLLEPFYSSLLHSNTVVHTLLGGGQWISVNNSVFIEQVPEAVKNALLQCNVSLVEVNANCDNALKKYYRNNVTKLQPAIARAHLKRYPNSYAKMSRDDKIAILKYCLSDGTYHDINGLQLLPLANGTFQPFQQKSSGYYGVQVPEIYLCTSDCPSTLLPGIDHKLVCVYNVDSSLHALLKLVADSSYTQLTVLGVSQVASLLSQCNTNNWGSSQMKNFWQWLSNKDLSHFVNQTIVPLNYLPGLESVEPLRKQSSVIYISPYSYSISSEVMSGLKKCKIKFADAREFTYLTHSQLSQYLYQFTADDILDAIQSTYNYANASFTFSEAQALQSFFSSASLTHQRLNVICTLHLFCSLQSDSSVLYSINTMKTHYCNNKAIAMSGSYDFRTDLLPNDPSIINTSKNNANLLYKLSGSVQFLNGAEFLERVGFKIIQNGQIATCTRNVIILMKSVLDNFYSFQRDSSQFLTSLRSLSFIETRPGVLEAPCNLYDPETELLTELFHSENKFPSLEFHPYLYIFRGCGLKTSVDASEILQVVNTISKNQSYYSNGIESVNETTYIRAVAVLKYLSSHTNLLNTRVYYNRSNMLLYQALINQVRQYSWLPITTKTLQNYPSCLTWKGAEYNYSLASTKFTPLIALTGDMSSSQLPLIIGSQAVFIENVPSNLVSSISCSSQNLIDYVVQHFHHVIENESEISDDSLSQISLQTYQYLNDNVRYCRANVLSGKWIWMENLSTFVDSSQVAIEANSTFRTSLEPFIFILPSNLRKFTDLFTTCGVTRQLALPQIISVLQSIKNTGSYKSSEVTYENAWLIVRAIIDWLVEDTENRLTGNVLVPVESDNEWPHLLPLSEVAYTDNEMLRDIASVDEESEYHLVHPRVSHHSSQLGLTPLSDHLDITEDVFEDAGQHEPLVTRLSNILREYKDGLTIIKEMIQNADDAGATEVNILYDNRTHSTENLLFKGMGQCHGPALIVHNNSTFTEKDFENITKLAGATKANQPLKIGKFGVGFCSVYHITDVPSFVSGEWLYIFDPTLKYLKGVVQNENRPGKKIKYQSKFLAKSKQLIPYEGHFNFSSTSTYNGTMFRLPFRTSPSQISSTIYKDDMIAQLKEALKSNGSQLLLFLQNVKKITFDSFNNSSNKVAIELTHNDDSIKSCITNTTQEEYWLMSTSKETLKSESTDKSAVASVACKLIKKDDNTFQCQIIDGSVFCFLPLSVPITGLPVHISANFAVMSNRSGIWTSTTGAASDSREAWNQQLMETVIPETYCNLLIKLRDMTFSGKLSPYEFHSLWPLEVNLQMRHPWDKLITSLYQLISQKHLFHSVSTGQWLTLEQSKFLPSSLFQGYIPTDTLNNTVTKLEIPVVSIPGLYFTQLRTSNRHEVNVITEYEFAKTFLSNVSMFDNSINVRNSVLYGMLSTVGIQQLKSHSDTFLFDLLKKYYCVPCSPNGNSLELACNLVDPNVLKDMFDPEDGKFPLEGFYNNSLIESVLVKLGLMKTDIPWTIIIDCAKTVERLFESNKEKALKRVTAVIKSINEKQDTDDLPQVLKYVPFLPVLQKPDNYILPWKGDGYSLLPPCQVSYDHDSSVRKHTVLVGSQQAIVNTSQNNKGGCGSMPMNVLTTLDISTRPQFNDVLNHFQCLINTFEPSMCEDADTHKLIEEICRCVYEYFEELLSELNKNKSTTNLLSIFIRQMSLNEADYTGSDEALAVFKDRPFIWTGQAFVSPCTVAKKWNVDKGPYLYKLPGMLSERKNLSKCLEIVDNFNFETLLNTLTQIHHDFQTNEVPEEIHPLIDNIMLELNSVSLPEDISSEIFLADDKYFIRPSHELVYNDADWFPVAPDSNIVHPRLTRERAKKFGIKFTSTKFLDQFTSSDQNFAGIEFGQREELTQRIKNILRDYPLDVTFLKELLQNADDAKATKMCVILDKRQHGTEKLLSKEWEELQGPAVLVWNDKNFSEKDLEGIQKLGLGSKRDDDESIGQFGIGFNVVYHLTDCPSFITREGSTLCVFDPHCKYVQGANVMCPGRRYDVNDEFWNSMSGLSAPYLQNSLPNQPDGLNSGVLFRFPLRSTKIQILTSELVNDRVKTEELTAEKMEKELDKWVEVIKESLIFLNHIIQFEYYIIDDSNQFECKRSYKVHITEDNHQKRVTLKEGLSSFKDTRRPLLKTYPITIESTLPYQTQQKWLVQQGVGDIQEPSKHWLFLHRTLPKHGIAAKLEYREYFTGKVFCFLPLPVYTDLPVHINGQFALNSNRRSLWSSSTEEPDDRSKWNENLIKAIASSYVQFLEHAKEFFISSEGYQKKNEFYNSVNGYYSLFPFWNPSFTYRPKDKDDVSAQTQIGYRSSPILIDHSLTQASHTRAITTNSTKTDWMGICTLVFNLLWSLNSKVLSSEQKVYTGLSSSDVIWHIQWHVLHNDDDPYRQAYFQQSDKELGRVLRKIGMILTCAPKQLYNHLKAEKPAIISKESVYQYYTKFHSKFLTQNCPCHIEETPFKSVENFCVFMQYLLTSYDVNGKVVYRFHTSPTNIPLLLTADCQLRAFQSSPQIMCSEYSKLFQNSLRHFLHPMVVQKFPYICPSYFVSVGNLHYGSIESIMKENYSPKLHTSVLEVNNSDASIISIEALKNLWACLTNDPYFKHHQNEIVNKWALIPLRSGLLYSASSPVLPLLKSNVEEELSDADKIFNKLTSLGIPIFNEIFEDFSAKEYCIKLSETTKVLTALYHLHDTKQVLSNLNNPQETIQILFKYFSRINFKNVKAKFLNYIKSFPLFKNTNGQYTDLKDRKIYLWPSDEFCNAGYDKWAPSNHIVFLERNGEWKKILGCDIETLQGKELNEREVYIDVIFPLFYKLTSGQRYDHLLYVKDNMFHYILHEVNKKQSQSAQKFLTVLKDLQCMKVKNGTLQSVKCFSDHTISIFATFSDHFSFVPKEYRDKEWLDFLSSLDLRRNVTIDEFIQFGNQVAKERHADLREASDVLVSYLFSHAATDHCFDDNSFSQISRICFVCVDELKELQWIKKSCQPPCYNQEQKVGLTSLSEAVVYDSAALVWTVKPVMKTLKYHNYPLLERLGVTLRPNTADVIQNLKNISQTRLANFELFDKYNPAYIFKDESQNFRIDSVVIQSLNYLFECNVASNELQNLSTVPFIPVCATGKKDVITQPVLVQPLQVVRFIPNDCLHFFPYVHILPPFMNSISHNLEDIGISQNITIKSVQHMLQMIYKHLGDSMLDLNNIVRVREAILKIHNLCKDIKYTLELIQQLSPLYYPDNHCCLWDTTKLVFIDLTRYKNAELNFSETQYSLFKLPSLPIKSTLASMQSNTLFTFGINSESVCLQLPKEVRPKGISIFCREEIFIETIAQETSPLSKHFNKLKDLGQHLITHLPKIIIAYVGEISVNREVIDRFTSTLVNDFIIGIQVKVIKDLRCKVKLTSGESVGIVNVPFLFKRDEANCVLYVDPSANIVSYTTCNEMVHMLCIEIARIHEVKLTSYFKFKIPVYDCIRVQSDADLKEVLEKYQINCTSIEVSDGTNDTDISLGGRIPDDIWDFLDYDINHIFHPEEWVVYEASQNYYVYAIVLYAIMEQNENNSLTKKYKILIGENADGTRNEEEVSALDLYKFITNRREKLMESPSQDLALVDSEGPTAELKDITDSLSILDLKRAIYDSLQKIIKLDNEDEKRKALKRLYLSYHPDKHDSNDCKRYTEAFKYLKKQIERYDSGYLLQNPDEESDTSTESVPTTPRREYNYREWDNYTRKPSYSKKNDSKTHHYQERGNTFDSTLWEHLLFNLQPKKDPEEAKCWLRQAKSDLNAMRFLLQNGSHPCQILFLAHEACEKALKAGMYQLVGLNPGSLKNHDLLPHAYAIASHKGGQWSQLHLLVNEMEKYYLYSRFPNKHGNQVAPVDVYGMTEAEEMAKNAEEVFEKIDKIIL